MNKVIIIIIIIIIIIMKNLTSFKFEPTTPNLLQHVAPRHNTVAKQANTLCPTMLRYVALKDLKCCDRLVEALYQDYGDGDLRVTNVEITFKSLHLVWIQRILKNDDEKDDTWSAIPKFYFNKCGVLPSFYKDILFSLLDLKSSV